MIIKLIQIVVAPVVYHLKPLHKDKRILQGILKYEFRNNYIVSLKFTKIGLYLLIISQKTKCITQVSIISIITLRNEKRAVYFTSKTSRQGCTLVCVGKIMTCCHCFYSQYKFVFSCIQLRYCTLTTISTAEVICTSHVVCCLIKCMPMRN